tara:strand:- start:729 stop:995 length:267 start_codon:yes stop_codon:yes gene_type:complete
MNQEPWHLSRSVPSTFILGLAVQTVVVIWFFATLNKDVEQNTSHIDRVESRVETMEVLLQNQAVSMARIDENIKAIRELVEFWSSKGI